MITGLKSPLNIAHRGASAYEPENTLRSFRRALEIGVEGMEFDVRRTADGTLVVIHDETVDRTTNGQGKVARMSLKEIQRLDAGQGEKVPTFEEVLAELVSQVLLVIELKEEGLGSEVSAALKAYPGSKNIIVSFHPAALRQFRAIDLEAQIGLLAHQVNSGLLQTAEKLVVNALGIYYPKINQEIVEWAHTRRMGVIAWPVDEPADIRHMLALGVDGICTNRPDVVRNVTLSGSEGCI